MAIWWLYGGYVFPVVVKPENLTFQVKFDVEGQDILHPPLPPPPPPQKKKKKKQ